MILKEDLKRFIPALYDIKYKSPDGVLTIKDSFIIIKKVFLWNGMTCYYDTKESRDGSCIHDCTYTYLSVDKDFPLSRKQCDDLLIYVLREDKAYTKAERKGIYFMVRIFGRFFGRHSTAIELNNADDGLGEVHTVYNKSRTTNEKAVHKYIRVKEDGEVFWVRFTKNKFSEGKRVALRNVEDLPK